MKQETEIPKSELKVLIVYPNLPLMLVPSLAVGIFTRVLKSNDYQVDLFDTTHYSEEEQEGGSTQERVKFLQVREFSEEEDLGINIRSNMLGDFRKKVLDFKPDLILFSIF